MPGLDKLIRETKDRCRYLFDREDISDQLVLNIKNYIRFEALSVTGASGTGIDQRGIFCGYPKRFVIDYLKIKHESWEALGRQFKDGPKHGHHTNFLNNYASTYPNEYESRYKPYGFQCGMQTGFFDKAGQIIGLVGGIKSAEATFSESEQKAIDTITPYIFFAFLRYRWLLSADFFSVICFDDFPFGIITLNSSGKINYLNESARQFFMDSMGTVPNDLPPNLKECYLNLESIGSHGSHAQPIYWEIETYVPQFGLVVCYKFNDECGGKYLPVKGSGWVLFIDSRKRDMEQKAMLSPRETDVIRMIGRGLQDKEIAYELGISEKTVQTYVRSLFTKLDTQNRTETAVKALRLGLL